MRNFTGILRLCSGVFEDTSLYICMYIYVEEELAVICWVCIYVYRIYILLLWWLLCRSSVTIIGGGDVVR